MTLVIPAIKATTIETVVTPQLFGAVGDGVANDRDAVLLAVEAAFGSDLSPNGTQSYKNRRLHFPAANYNIEGGPIMFPPVYSGMITGDGSRASRFVFGTGCDAGGFLFPRGLAFSTLRDIGLRASVPGPTLVKVTSDGSYFASQGNLFQNCFAEYGSIGLHIHEGTSGQGSENIISGFQARECADSGIKIEGYNALANTVIGGNIAGCQYGIRVVSGSMSVFATGFQRQTEFDIRLENHAHSPFILDAIRTESRNFLQALNKQRVRATVSHLNYTEPGWLMWSRGGVVLSQCYSAQGQFGIEQGEAILDHCAFGREDWLGNVGVNSRVSVRHLVKSHSLPGETLIDEARYVGGVAV